MNIYTIGYRAGWDVTSLRAELFKRDALLIDIRTSTHSHFPVWRGNFLAAWLPMYVHVVELGNQNYKSGGAITLWSEDGGVRVVRSLLEKHPYKPKSIALLCGCADVATCHRSYVAELLSRRLGGTVEHLAPPPPSPMVNVLSVRQPWAWAIFHSGKDIENRNRPYNCHGELFIHASQGMTLREYDDAIGMFPPNARIPSHGDLIHGAIIGVVTVGGSVTQSASPWFHGPHGIPLMNQRLLASPVPTGGGLGVWEYPLTPELHVF